MFIQKTIYVPCLHKTGVANVVLLLLLFLTAEFWIWIQASTDGCVFHNSIRKKNVVLTWLAFIATNKTDTRLI